MNRGESLQDYDLRLDATIQVWWNGLDEDRQAELLDGDDWEDLSDEEQLDIYRNNNPTPEEQRENYGDFEAHRRMVEGDYDPDLEYHDRKCEGED